MKAIEDFVPGDEILTRDEDDPNAPVHAQVGEAVSFAVSNRAIFAV